MALQIRAELRAVTWPGGTQQVVFGDRGVVIFAGLPTEEQIPPGFPWCLVGLGDGEVDEEQPEFIQQRYTLLTGVDVAGDPLGEFSIIGGSIPDFGSSVGRGVAEVADRVRAAVQDLTGADGARIQLSSISTGTPTLLGQGRHLALDELTLQALCTSQPHYAAPQVLRVSGTSWTWEGPHCSSRYDFLQYRLIEKTGTTPSKDPSEGTTVYTGTTASTTFTPLAGQTYTIFADYDARGIGSVEDSSEPELGSYVVIP